MKDLAHILARHNQRALRGGVCNIVFALPLTIAAYGAVALVVVPLGFFLGATFSSLFYGLALVASVITLFWAITHYRNLVRAEAYLNPFELGQCSQCEYTHSGAAGVGITAYIPPEMLAKGIFQLRSRRAVSESGCAAGDRLIATLTEQGDWVTLDRLKNHYNTVLLLGQLGVITQRWNKEAAEIKLSGAYIHDEL